MSNAANPPASKAPKGALITGMILIFWRSQVAGWAE